MKIALVCSSLGYAYRGFERFSLELFDHVKEKVSITLFGTHSTRRAGEISLPCIKFDSKLLENFKGKRRDNYFFQQLSYACSFIPLVVLKSYDIVHFSEPAIGLFLYHAKRLFKFRYKLLFTDGLGLDPCLNRRFFETRDHTQAITMPHYEMLLRTGGDSKKVCFLPYGVDSGRYSIKQDQASLREKYGIPKNKFVILTVAALNRRHKRIDYIIQEVSRLGKDYFLLVVGQPEEPDLIELGHRILGENFKSIYVSFNQVSEIYPLADLFVFGCLVGEFGLALAEAMCAGIPLIADRYFEWMVQDERCLADLSQEGNLARKIEEVASDYDSFQELAKEIQTNAIRRFEWDNLIPQYLDMYEHVYHLKNGHSQ